MQTAVEITVGIVAALALIVFARIRSRGSELFVYAIGLVIAALIYPAFTVINGGMSRVGTEVIGVAVFSTIALLGLRLSPVLLAFGWTTHVAWDVLLHGGDGSAYVPSWYPTVCVGFDLLLAGYIVAALRSRDP